jgi:hypothetical protein
MAEPRVPGSSEPLTLPCGERIEVRDVDMGMREFACDCGDVHAVVTDVHPPERFLPEFLVTALREVTEVTDEFGEFGMPHLMASVVEEYPEAVTVADASDDGYVGYALLWVTDFDSRRLHEVIVELTVELMEHAMSHSGDDDAMAAFEAEMLDFDVGEFVDAYRAERDLHADDVPGYERG